MPPNHIAQLEADLGKLTDQLCANSELTGMADSMPVLGLIFGAAPPTVFNR